MQFGRVLLADQQTQLIRIPTEDEIKRALFDMGDLKALEPDGYNSKFYKTTRDTVKHDFTTAIWSFSQMANCSNHGTMHPSPLFQK